MIFDEAEVEFMRMANADGVDPKITDADDLWGACHCCLCDANVDPVEHEAGVKFKYHDQKLAYPRFCAKCDSKPAGEQTMLIVETIAAAFEHKSIKAK